jgi:D-alanyl-D-alanine carboxypeptidase (penicillin-binding protein 5/6)
MLTPILLNRSGVKKTLPTGANLVREVTPSVIAPTILPPVTPIPVPVPKPKPGYTAAALLSIYRNPAGESEVVLAKNADAALPIASITKLVTALVAREKYPQDQPVVVKKENLLGFIDPSVLKEGDNFTVGSLMYPLLVESSNDTAAVLAAQTDPEKFVSDMNLLVEEIGMNRSHFYNPTGLDGANLNRSSAYDLARLAAYLVDNHPEILNITTLQGYDLFTTDGRLHHRLVNTDKLLSYQGWPAEIVGGKTGTTDQSKRCLLLILRDKKTGGYLINVVLGADDNFADMKMLIDWVYANYDFL